MSNLIKRESLESLEEAKEIHQRRDNQIDVLFEQCDEMKAMGEMYNQRIKVCENEACVHGCSGECK